MLFIRGASFKTELTGTEELVLTLVVGNIEIGLPDQLIRAVVAIDHDRGGAALLIGIDSYFVELHFRKLAKRLARLWAPRFLVDPRP
jgi:hypothetical protein